MNEFEPCAGRIRHAIGRGYSSDEKVLEVMGTSIEILDVCGRTPIFRAVLWKRNELLAKLISMGANVSHADADGRTPLHFAVYDRNVEAARLLLEAGAPVDAQDHHGNTPLWSAIMQFKGFKEMIRLLISFGASPDSRNIYGKSPRDVAMSKTTSEAREWLQEMSPATS